MNQLYPTSQLLSELIGFGCSPNKAVVGANAFAHESGIHQHGMLANPLTYEIMTPESVGVTASNIWCWASTPAAAPSNSASPSLAIRSPGRSSTRSMTVSLNWPIARNRSTIRTWLACCSRTKVLPRWYNV